MIFAIVTIATTTPLRAQKGMILPPPAPVPHEAPPPVQKPMSRFKRSLIGGAVGFAVGSFMWRLPWAAESCLSDHHWRCAAANGAVGAAFGVEIALLPHHERAPKRPPAPPADK